MSVLTVPRIDARSWPTLGGQVCDFIEEHLVHGPGDLRGQPAQLDEEKRALIFRMYEVYPRDHKDAGRRRFKRCAISLRKGSAKTEFAAWVSIVEAHPEGPVRTVAFDGRGHPLGGPVTDPYIPMVAYTAEQSEELAYGALRVILENCDLGADFDIGLERVMRVDGDGKVEPLASAPDARDGARTTFQLFDETHRFVLPRLKRAHTTMLANIPKRMLSDAWSLEITTAPAPGQGSVAEDTMEYALALAEKRTAKADPRLFFFHRQAKDSHKLTTKRGLRAAVVEASGPVAAWSDINAICQQWDNPKADKAYLERVWLNRCVRSAERAFDAAAFKLLVDPKGRIKKGAKVTLGFDGARYRDSTALVATEVTTGFQVVVGVWEQPEILATNRKGERRWEVPADEVDLAVAGAFETWDVWRMYADPFYWDSFIASWSGAYGEKVVVEWPTNRWSKMAAAIRSYVSAIVAEELSHDGSEALVRHIGNAHRRELKGVRDDQDQPMWVIQKERSDSPHKIDVAMASILSWEARLDAVADGEAEDTRSVYEDRGLVVI